MPTRSTPSAPRRRLGFSLVTVARHWRRAIDLHLQAAGLTDTHWAPLVHLQDSDGLTQKALAQRLGTSEPSLVRVVDILVAQGRVERRPAPHDGRARQLFLTAAGRAAVADIRRLLWRVEAELLRDIDEDELATALGVLDKIGQRLAAGEAAP